MTLTSLHLVKCYISGKHVNYGALSQADFITCRQNQVRSSPFLFFILNFFETFEGFKSSHLQELFNIICFCLTWSLMLNFD